MTRLVLMPMTPRRRGRSSATTALPKIERRLKSSISSMRPMAPKTTSTSSADVDAAEAERRLGQRRGEPQVVAPQIFSARCGR